MLLRVQPYALDVQYKQGSLLYIADTLSRHYLPNTASETREDEYEVHILETGKVSKTAYDRLIVETKGDPELSKLYKIVMNGWPDEKSMVPVEIQPYFNFRDEIGAQDGLLFKGERIIIPHTMRDEIMERIHIGHLGKEKCKARARASVFWPGINAMIDDLLDHCSTCLRFQRSQQKEPLLPLDVPERPWQTIGADYFYYKGQDYLLLVDYFSKYPEVIRVNQKTAESTIKAMKDVFARHGIPEKLIADNMPFDSVTFRTFARDWEMEVITSSPHYAKSHGQVERFVQIMKQMLRKAEDAGQDAYKALLEFRNTPITELGFSPAQLLMSRRLRSPVPVASRLLKPETVENVREKLLQRQLHMKSHYDKGSRPLSSLKPGDTARVRRGREWEPAVVIGKHDTPRSYEMMTADGKSLRRNRSHLLATKEPSPTICGPADMPHISSPAQERPHTSSLPQMNMSPPARPAPVPTAQQSPKPLPSGFNTYTRSGRASVRPARYTP